MTKNMNSLPLPSSEGTFDDPQSPAYQPKPDDQHLARSQETLQELVEVINGAGMGGTPLHVCLHSVVNTFAHPLLYMFNLEIIDANGEFADLEDPGGPFHMAVVANQPVELQVESALGMLAQFIERQQAVVGIQTSDDPIDSISARAAAADRVGHDQTVDELRYGWRSAARATARRALEHGLRLEVDYEPRFVTSTEQARRRYPLLRRVYNEFDDFRELVDRIVGVIAGREMRVAGGAERTRLWLQQRAAVSGTVQYFAQGMRDAVVLGNGYVRFTGTEPIGAYNLRPENTQPIHRLQARDLRTGETLDRVLVFDGFEQPGTALGLGIAELMMGSLRQRDVIERGMRDLAPFEHREPRVSEYVQRVRALAEAQGAQVRQRVQELFGWWVNHAPPALDGLYFPGQEEM